jgi:hypothetical protein
VALKDQIELVHGTKAQTAAPAARLQPAPHGISKPCSTKYKAVHYSGTRPLSAIKWVVMHSTEGDSALGAAAWFANPNSGGSAHLCIDDKYCFRTLRDNQVPWGAPGANTNGFHIEQAGYAKWSTLIWSSKHRATLERAAYKAALHCRKFGIPPVFIDHTGLKAGRPGITTHMECTKAFGGSHTDPGAGWPRGWFMRRVKYHHKQLWHVKPVG